MASHHSTRKIDSCSTSSKHEHFFAFETCFLFFSQLLQRDVPVVFERVRAMDFIFDVENEWTHMTLTRILILFLETIVHFRVRIGKGGTE